MSCKAGTTGSARVHLEGKRRDVATSRIGEAPMESRTSPVPLLARREPELVTHGWDIGQALGSVLSTLEALPHLILKHPHEVVLS